MAYGHRRLSPDLSILEPTMAYLAFDFETAPATANTTAFAPVEADALAAFSAREWQVIRLARRDRAARPSSRLTRLASLLFGLRVENPLADARLEALRSAATQLWRSAKGLDHNRIGHLRAQGFSLGQLALLSAWIGARR